MSDDGDTIDIQTKGLDQLLKALKVKPPVGRIGILGDKDARSSGGSNASIGMMHEYGISPMPQRSFLRQPLNDNLDKAIESEGAIDEDVLKEVIKNGSVIPWLQKIMIIAEKIVLGAFDSNGYGKWQAWKTPGYTNNTGMILVDSQQLRNSITTDVKA